MFEELIEQLVKYFSRPPHQGDFERAKAMYGKTLSVVVEEHPYFDTWISGFFEWYLIDYKMEKTGIPPVYLYQRIFADELDSKEMNFLHEMEQASLNLFEIQSVSGQKIKAQNLYEKKTQDFTSHENTTLMQKGDYIVTRLMRSPQLTKTFGVIWHLSGEIAPIVNKKLGQIQTNLDEENFLYELIKRKTQSEVYSHVPLDQIFGWKTGAEMKVPPRTIK